MNEPTVLVIGGGKFVGRHIVARLLAEGYKTTMLTRGISPNPFEGLVESLKCDREDVATFDTLLYRRGFDYVIDVVSFTADHARHAAEFFFGRTSRFIHISSAAVYLLNDDRLNPFREDDAPASIEGLKPIGGMAEYGLHKRAGELEIEKAISEKGFPAVIFRPAVISGPYDYTQRDYGYIKRVIDGGPILLPLENRGCHRHTSVADVVDAVMLGLTSKDAPGKIFNITSYTILSMPDYLSIIARALDTKADIIYMPHGALKADLGSNYSPFAYARDFIQDVFRARCVIGFKPSRADIWLADLAHYYAEEYKGDPPEEYVKRREKELALAKKMKGAGA